MIKAGPTETILDISAATWIAGCSAYAIAIVSAGAGNSVSFPLAMVGSGVSWFVAYDLLRRLRGHDFPMPSFTLQAMEAEEPLSSAEDERFPELLLTADMGLLRTELLLTEGQRLDGRAGPDAAPPPVELVLDDILAELGPESRVVRLFDPSKMPTAGELQSRIDRHLSRSTPAEAATDDTQALYAALADLRRSLA